MAGTATDQPLSVLTAAASSSVLTAAAASSVLTAVLTVTVGGYTGTYQATYGILPGGVLTSAISRGGPS